jgi:shikimate kinase
MANQPARMIFLVGFMGAGKTTVGRLLAERIGYSFFDLDQLIEARASKSIREIFDESGEAAFRELEREEIASCRRLLSSVVALGGGAYVSRYNRDLVRAMGKTIWLDCPLEVCLARLGFDPARPLLGSHADMKALFRSRSPSYSEADYTIDAGDHPPEEIVKRISELLDAR